MSGLIIFGRSPMVVDIPICDKRVMNTDEFVNIEQGATYVSCIGSPKSYKTKVEVLDKLNIIEWCNLIIKNNYEYNIFYEGQGNLIFPSFISKSVKLGRHCLIMPNSTIHHDCELGDGTNVASNVCLNGCVKIEGNCFIGAGAVIKENVSICKNVLIGAGSVVIDNISKPGTYYGLPAKWIKE